MRRRVLVAAALLLAMAGPGPVVADLPPPRGYVERCTLEAMALPGQECRLCGASFASRAECDQLGRQGYQNRCRSYGASVWREVWCRPLPSVDQAGTKPAVVLEPHGVMAGLPVPAGWTWQRRAGGDTQDLWLYPPGRADVVVWSRLVDRPLDEGRARAVRGLLEQPVPEASGVEAAASLLATVAERSSATYQQDFRPRLLRTEGWNGRKALIVEGQDGRTLEREHARYVDASGCGRLVQVVAYRAPAPLYDHYLEAVKTLLAAVRWGPLREDVCR